GGDAGPAAGAAGRSAIATPGMTTSIPRPLSTYARYLIFSSSKLLFQPPSAMRSTEVMNLTRLPEDCSLEDIHYHRYVLIRIGTALAEAQWWMNIPALSLQNQQRQGLAVAPGIGA